jgi:hypothetical protein
MLGVEVIVGVGVFVGVSVSVGMLVKVAVEVLDGMGTGVNVFGTGDGSRVTDTGGGTCTGEHALRKSSNRIKHLAENVVSIKSL